MTLDLSYAPVLYSGIFGLMTVGILRIRFLKYFILKIPTLPCRLVVLISIIAQVLYSRIFGLMTVGVLQIRFLK
jgi:hypothetical protein